MKVSFLNIFEKNYTISVEESSHLENRIAFFMVKSWSISSLTWLVSLSVNFPEVVSIDQKYIGIREVKRSMFIVCVW